MNKRQLSQIISKAYDICAHSGGRLTSKRKRILEILLLSKTPLSAYEVADSYNKCSECVMPTMSVYRMLDFLESERLVHKLSSTNKYVACLHIACDHAHEIPQFLICGNCQAVKEIRIPKHLVDELGTVNIKANYKLINPQLELQCLCQSCSNLAA